MVGRSEDIFGMPDNPGRIEGDLMEAERALDRGKLGGEGLEGVECPKSFWGGLKGPLKAQKCFEEV